MIKRWSIKEAFTLAEVLITIGVIGIVSALTLPNVIQNTKKNEATAKIKKFISVINQALIRAELDYGNREDWIKGEMNNYDSSIEFLNTYIKPYITNSKIEKGGATITTERTATLKFSDGSQMSIKVGKCYDIFYDINGKKGPNERGRDVFQFILCRKSGECNVNSNQVRPYYCQANGIKYPTHEEIIDNCKNTGTYCTILLQENQYEFPKDYPKRL